MARVGLRLTTLLLALIGAATLVGWFRPLPQDRPSTPSHVSFVSSPDGRFKAALGWWEGGGAIAPFCYNRVFVLAHDAPESEITNQGNVVFEGNCAAFTRSGGLMGDAPEISWLGPGVLQISFSTRDAVRSPEVFRLRRLAASGQVAIEFKVGN
jgi:hypothetical protein